jgi:hypothetical protein
MKDTVFSMQPMLRLYNEGQIAWATLIPMWRWGRKPPRIPMSRRRRQKGNPNAWWYNGAPCFWGIQILGPSPPSWGSLESETVKCGHEAHGIWTWEWLCWQGPAAILTTDPSSCQRGCYVRIMTTTVQLKNQGACRQDELTGGKQLVIK